MNDIAGGRTVLGSTAPVQLFAGEAKITTIDYPTTIDVVKYQVVSVDATGNVVTFDATLKNAVIASQPALNGDTIAFFDGGNFNHEALVWPAGLTTYAQRRVVTGPNATLKIGHLVN